MRLIEGTRHIDGVRPLLIMIVLLLCGCQVRQPVVVVSAALAFVGRWFPTAFGCHTTIAQGNSINISVHDAGAFYLRAFTPSAAKQEAVIAVRVDQGPFRRIKVPLADEPRTIRLATFRRTDHVVQIVAAGIFESAPVWKSGSGLSVCGAALDRGTFRPVHLPEERVLFVGDSITAGILVLRQEDDTTSLPENGAAEQCYAFLTAERLKMQPMFAAYGSAGLLVPGNGCVPDAQQFISAYREGMPLRTDHADLIVINLGTNGDRLLTPADTEQIGQRFTQGYVRLINALRAANPSARVVLLSPFTVRSSLDTALPIIARRSGATLIDTRGWPVSTVDRVHPDASGSETVAELLYTRLQFLVAQ